MKELTISYISIDEIEPNPWNPNEQTALMFDKTAASICSEGFVDPLTVRAVNGKFEIIDGEHRYKAFLRLVNDFGGMPEETKVFYNDNVELQTLVEKQEIPAINLGDVDDDTARRLTLQLNGIRGEDNEDKLALLVATLKERSNLKELAARLPQTQGRLQGLLDQLKANSGAGEDDPPDIDDENEPITQYGDLWLLGKHRVLCGDSTKAEDVERVMGGDKAGLMVTDPPYGVNYQGGAETAIKRERLVGDTDSTLYARAFRLSSVNVLYAWFAGTEVGAVWLACKENGYNPRSMIIWNKLKPHYGGAGANYCQKHEACLYCVKESPAKFIGRTNECTVWDIEQPHINEYHPTQKPLECMERPIKNHDYPVVYDPFLGSGTTLIGAENQERKLCGIEINAKYCDVIVKRYLNQSDNSDNVFVERNGEKIAWADLAEGIK
jgi:ParB family chromosome partitioning protein